MHSALFVGQRFDGYVIDELPQGGAFGDVAFVSRENDGSSWFIKRVTSDPDAIRDLKNEARTMSSIRVPGVVCPRRLGFSDELGWYLVMPRAPGVSLRAILDEGGLTKERVWSLVQRLAHVLRVMHGHGLMHLDLKPENIHLGAEDEPFLLDFGLSRWQRPPAGALTADDAVGGSLAYMAPEVFAGATPSPAVDWYALGRLYHELLTGEMPSLAGELSPSIEAPHRARIEHLTRLEPHARGGADLLLDLDLRSAPSSMVGRSEEFAHVLEVWARGAYSGLNLCGPAGVGKSRLSGEVLARLRSVGVPVLEGRCYDMDSTPYRGLEGLEQVLWHHRESLTTAERDAASILCPELLGSEARGVVDPAALHGLLHRIMGTRRHVLFIDDFQWMSRDAQRLVQRLCTAAPLLPIFVLTCSRLADCGTLSPDRVAIELGPLSDEATRAYLTEHVGEVPRAVVEQVGGNPFLMELLALAPRGSTPTSWVTSHLRSLDSVGRDVVEALALSQVPLSMPVVGHVGGSAAAVAERIPAWVADRWVIESEDALEIYHDRFRHILAPEVEPERAQRLHGKVLDAHLSAGSPPQHAFPHAVACGRTSLAAGLARRAADTAWEVQAFDSAALWYERASNGVEEGDRAHLVRRAGISAKRSGRLEMARRYLTERVEHQEDVNLLAETLLLLGHEHLGLETLAPVLKALNVPAPRPAWRSVVSILWRVLRNRRPIRSHDPGDVVQARFDVMWTLARGYTYTKPVLALDYALQAMDAASVRSNRSGLAYTLAFVGGGVFGQIPLLRTRGVGWLAEAHVLAAEQDDSVALALAHCFEALMLTGEGDFERGLSLAERSVELLAGREGVHWERFTADQTWMWFLHRTGQFKVLAVAASDALLGAEGRGDVLARAVYSHFVALSEITAGRPGRGLTTLSWIEAEWMPDTFTPQHFFTRVIQIEAHLAMGSIDAAAELWRATQGPYLKASLNYATTARIDNHLAQARIAVALNDVAQVDVARTVLTKEQRPDAQAVVQWLSHLRGEAAPEAVVRAFEAASMPHLADGFALQVQTSDTTPLFRLRERGVLDPHHWARTLVPAGMGAGTVAPQ